MILSLAADQVFPEPAAKDKLEGVIRQLEECWKQVFEPMPSEEAYELLAEVLPD